MHSISGSPWSFFAIRMSLFGVYTPEPTMFPTLCSFGGMKEPSVYTQCCGLYLEVFMW